MTPGVPHPDDGRQSRGRHPHPRENDGGGRQVQPTYQQRDRSPPRAHGGESQVPAPHPSETTDGAALSFLARGESGNGESRAKGVRRSAGSSVLLEGQPGPRRSPVVCSAAGERRTLFFSVATATTLSEILRKFRAAGPR